MQVYVDDPLVTMRASESRVKRLATMVIVGWMLLGFPLAFHKAVMAPTLTWVGVKLQILPSKIRVEVPEPKVLELITLVDEVSASNVVAKRKLRTLIGKAIAIASVIYTSRPFTHGLYSALRVEDSHAPQGCVWTRQLYHSLAWIKTFLSGEGGCIERIYSKDNFLTRGPRVLTTWGSSRMAWEQRFK